MLEYPPRFPVKFIFLRQFESVFFPLVGSKILLGGCKVDFEVISPYCGIYREENTVNVYYLQTEDLVRAYVFSKIKDAQEFCNAAKNLLEFMVNVPKGKEQLYHQEFLELTIKNKEYELIVYEAMPEEEREAG